MMPNRRLRGVWSKDARIHFAVNCASVSCPALAAQPYRAETLEAQLNEAAAELARRGHVRIAFLGSQCEYRITTRRPKNVVGSTGPV